MAERDPEVIVYQKRLRDVGLYSGEVDGDFGPKTLTAALKSIESLKVVEGDVGPVDGGAVAGGDVDGAPTWMDELVPILTEFEGFRSNAYWDATGKVWTIGYGTTVYPDGSKVKKGDVVSKARAVECMEHDVLTIRKPALERGLKVPQNDNQMAALICFAYNVGVGSVASKKGLLGSGLMRAINSGQPSATCASYFAAWNKSGGKVLSGLVRRRAAEAKLYLTPVKVQRMAEVDIEDAIGVGVDNPDVA